MKERVLVIIVTYNAMKWLKRCIDSLLSSTLLPDIFIVDNGSKDGTQEYIKNHLPKVIFQQSKTNIGFGKANNIGLQYALDYKYDYVYLLNQDAWIFPDTLEKLLSVSKSNPKYGILSPLQMEANMHHLDYKFKRYVCSWESSPNLLDTILLGAKSDIITVNYVMAAHWLISRNCLLRVGGFSSTFQHYGEDGNYADRVIFWGLKLGIVPSVFVVHDREKRVDSKEKKMYFMYMRILRMLSRPQGKGNIGVLILKLFLNSFSYRSIMPIKYIWRLFVNHNQIEEKRIISKEIECAFLSN